LRFPSTFDGSLPSEAFGRQSSRVLIGETYFFGKEAPLLQRGSSANDKGQSHHHLSDSLSIAYE